MALLIGILAAAFVIFYAFFYPKNYVKNENGDYVNVTAPKAETFPVTKDTTFEIEHYYPDEQRRLTEQITDMPTLLGCDRAGVNNYLEDYMRHLSYEERDQGLISFELVSYQDNHLCFRKTYRKQEYQGYYAKSFNGTIVILNGDGKTVYEYTQIAIDSLPDDLQLQVLEGYPLENEEDLYSFLENYST
ncbi:MAG: hypothetical protein NC124_18955, partial [Clostridium sp.]|nr:hypothetical protein [Clostridium sp.]